MADNDFLVRQFESHRGHIRAVAYRMLGSAAEAEDAVQEAWIRLARSDATTIGNLGGWLTTVVARVCLDMLRARKARREEPIVPGTPEPATEPTDQEAMLADSIGVALLVVLDTLSPAERVAFVLHDSFDVPFDEIADVLGRSEAAARQLASRGRRRVRAAAVEPDVGVPEQRRVVDAFLAAARDGDLEALVAVLDPDVALRADGGRLRAGATMSIRGAREVASRAITFSGLSPFVTHVLVNGVAAALVAPHGRPFSLMVFTVRGGRITAMDSIVDPERLRALDPALLGAA